jgi:agmatine/peptidylarginine deiminase
MKSLKRGAFTLILTLSVISLIIPSVLNVNVAGSIIRFDEPVDTFPDTILTSPEVSWSAGQDYQPLAAPPAPVRQPGEFEPMQGVMVRYPKGISYALIAEMSEDVEVVTIVADNAAKTTVETDYISNGVNMANCKWLIAPSNTYWTRDYGPWFIFNGNGEQGIINHTYNRPSRTDDNAIPERYAENRSITDYKMDMITAGGNYMCDGVGIAASTDLVIDENPSLTKAQIEQMALNYLGIHTYHLVPDALGEYIKHIDCWAKFLAPDKILIGQVPSNHKQFDE